MYTYLSDMPHLGKVSEEILLKAGILTPEDLEKLGPVDAYLRCKEIDPRVSINLLWAIFCSLNDIPWGGIPKDIMEQLRSKVQ